MKTPIHKVTRGAKGWQKWLNGRMVWVAGFKEAPTPADADRVFGQRCDLPPDDPRKIRIGEAAPRVERPEDITVETIANAFLTRKLKQVEAGRVKRETYEEYLEAVQSFVDHAGADRRFRNLSPVVFSDYADGLSGRFGLARLKKYIIIVRMMFRWAGPPQAGVGLVPTVPAYGEAFKLPSRAEFRREANLARQRHGPKRYTPAEIREQLDGKVVAVKRRRVIHGKVVKDVQKRRRKPSAALKAMILLGLNGGFGNRDCAFLPTTIAEPATRGDEWMDYARDKTGVQRLFWLWPETRAAMEAWWKVRQRIKPAKGSIALWGEEREFKDLFFLTVDGRPFIDGKKDQVGMRYLRLLEALGQPSRGFRSLRRTCRTKLAETGQELAIDLIMGHADDAADMAKVYTVEVSKEIIKQVCQHGRQGLLFADHQPMLFNAT